MSTEATHKLRTAVIGLGIARNYLQFVQQHPGAELCAVADQNRERRKQAGEKFGVKALYADGDELLEKERPDAVIIAIPNIYHLPMTLKAFEVGAHVLCEKPMAMNTGEARQMIAAGQKAGKRLMINFSFRFTPQSQQLKREVDSGALGDIYFARTQWLRRDGFPHFGGWFGQKALSGGGPLIDLGVHRLDLALWLMGYPQPEWVFGRTYDHLAQQRLADTDAQFDVEDFATALVSFKNGATLELSASWASHIREREMMHTRLLGTKGGLIQCNLNEGYSDWKAEIYTFRNGAHHNIEPHPPIPNVGSSITYFLDAMIADKPHMATGDEGLIVMELLDAIYESARQGKPVRVNPHPENS